MKFPNKYLRNLKPYKLASHKIWTVKPEEREQILKLDWNEASMPPSPKVRERIAELLNEPEFFNLYPTTYNERFMNALSSYIGLPKENLQYFASSDALHEYICKVFVSVGDPVLILGPSYDNFRLTCQANGAEVFWSNYTDDFKFDREKFEEDIYKYEPAIVYICNPNNPTGNFHEPLYIEHLLNTFSDTLFLLDEAYMEFAEGSSSKDLVLKYDNILISRTMSKAFALANFRVGYLIASKDNVQFINKIRNPKNLTTFGQEAATAALEDYQYMEDYVKEVKGAQKWFKNELEKNFSKYMKPIESAGNFTMIEFPMYEAKIDLLNYLAENNIFVRDCTQGPTVRNWFRITIGTKKQMERVFGVIKAYYANKR